MKTAGVTPRHFRCKSADAYFCDECFTDFQDELEAKRSGCDV